MRTGDKRIFDDEKLLKEMLELRSAGWSYLKLAKKYNCDHTSILYQCKKANNGGIVIKKILNPDRPKRQGVVKKGHCPMCELLLTSEFFCEYCKDAPEKQHEKISA